MKHSSPETLAALDAAWDPEQGVLGKLRDGNFDPDLAKIYISFLEGIEVDEGERLHPDFVRLLWFTPLFSEWQSKRMAERPDGEHHLEAANFANKVRECVMQILGIP